MTIIAYQESQQISRGDWAFQSLIMAAMRKADDDNLAKLEQVFPETLAELWQRYNAPGGALNQQEMAFIERQAGMRRQEASDAEFDDEYD